MNYLAKNLEKFNTIKDPIMEVGAISTDDVIVAKNGSKVARLNGKLGNASIVD